jgi:hypothetical protein
MSRAVLGLQVATLAALLWVGASQQRQIKLTETLIQQEHAMTTPYVDTDGMTHTVSTPYRESGMALAHKQDLWDAFHEFKPAQAPSWYDPNHRPT